MKLIYPEWEKQIEFNFDKVPVISIEEPRTYFRMISELQGQIQTGEGRYLLYKGEKELDLRKKMIFIPSPWNMEVNDRQLLKKLYAKVQDLAMEEQYYQKTQAVMGSILQFMEEITQEVALPLTYTWEPAVSELCKAVMLEVDTTGMDLMEKMIAYMKTWTELCGETCFVFNQFRCCMDRNKLADFYSTALEEKLPFIMIENSCDDRIVQEDLFVIDEDLCQIF